MQCLCLLTYCSMGAPGASSVLLCVIQWLIMSTGCVAQNQSDVIDGSVRLANGPSVNQGRVEVFHNGVWGTVCDYLWGYDEADVVCKQMGYSRAISHVTGGYFGHGTGQVWMDRVKCTGSEARLADCQFRGWGIDGCSDHTDDTGVICANATNSGDYLPLRLVNGSMNSNNTERLREGHVEVLMNGEWGTVCSRYWGLTSAQVVCKQLGFAGALVATEYVLEEDSLPVHFRHVSCRGNEPSLSQCSMPPLNGDCYSVAGVQCTRFFAITDVRLVSQEEPSNPTPLEGRVELSMNGHWGTICSDFWDLADAIIVCRMLGFSSAFGAGTVSSDFIGSGPIWMDNVQCEGREWLYSSLEACTSRGWGVANCNHNQDATVTCDNSRVGIPVHLVGGVTPTEGRVEMLYTNEWGTLCSHGWSQEAAVVVCRQLGLAGGATSVLSADSYGLAWDYKPIWIVHQCFGNESFLSDCTIRDAATYARSCSHGDDVAVVCSNKNMLIPVRLANGTSPSSGRVEIEVRPGTWGTICDLSWDVSDAGVVCRQLGYPGTAVEWVFRKSYFGSGDLPIVTSDTHCSGSEPQLYNCTGLHPTIAGKDPLCNYGTIAGVRCVENYSPTHPLRLVGGNTTNEGRIEVFIQASWVAICAHGWNYIDAKVVCRQLGLSPSGAIPLSYTNSQDKTATPFAMSNVHCSGLELYVTDCPSDALYLNTGLCSRDAGVRCRSSSESEFSNPVRLMEGGGPGAHQGNVEILYAGAWGGVCDDYWSFSEARVVCHMLGYSDAMRAFSNTYFGGSNVSGVVTMVRCDGNETEISECSHQPFGQFQCNSNKTAGVACTSTPQVSSYPLRLVGGDSPGKGRVEVMFNGEWGSVCGDTWNFGLIVCQQLGFTRLSQVFMRSEYGRGSGPIWMDRVQCSAQDITLSNCLFDGWGKHDCSHGEEAGIICRGELLPVRLVNGSTPMEGRVEVNYKGLWGTVCSNFWDESDARVVCRQLGFHGTLAEALINLEFGGGTGTIHFDDVSCAGTESNLHDCQYQGASTFQCTHSQDAGVRCSNDLIPPESMTVRLTGGGSLWEGRVEVSLDGVTYGSLCSDSWDIHNANVVCRQLGFSHASAAYSLRVGSTGRRVYLHNVHCYGNELSLSECSSSAWGVGGCGTIADAAVRCYVAGEQRIRLMGGDSPNSGRVEVYHDGVWGTVCLRGWGMSEANVVCRNLGYSRALVTPGYGLQYPRGSGKIWLSDIECSGTENSIYDCPHSGWENTFGCSHYWDVGVVCSPSPRDPYPIRLNGGATNTEGRVEIFVNNEWGSICSHHWSDHEVLVACRQLGFSSFLNIVIDINRFGPGSGRVWLDGVTCTGREDSINECQHPPFGGNSCDHTLDVGVVCYPSVLQIRLAGINSSRSQGLVEVSYDRGEWGTICDTNWSIRAADVVCQMLGFGSALEATFGASPFGEGHGSVLLDDVVCVGNETSLLACSHSGFGEHSCRHIQDAGVVCSSHHICAPVSVIHGSVTFALTVSSERPLEGSVVTVSCDEGYVPYQGVTVYTCGREGVWQPQSPGCGVSCPELPLPPHVTPSSLQLFPGTRVSFTCSEEGTVLQGPVAVTCLSEGRWSAYPPECIGVFCPPVEVSSHLLVTGEGVSAGTNISFHCSQGWHLVGASYAVCLPGGQWSNPTPLCQEGALCPSLSDPHGVLRLQHNSSSALVTGTAVTITCDSSYEPVMGVAMAMCSSDGTWQPRAPACGAMCGALPLAEHLHYSSFNTFPGASVSFSCDSTYILEGAGNVTCSNGEWSSTVPTCTQRSCPPISLSDPHLQGSNVVMSSAVGTTVQFGCEAGWRLRGSLSITCQPDGTWSGLVPRCEEQDVCPPFDLSNGSFSLQHDTSGLLTVGTLVTIHCSQGYGPTRGYGIAACHTDLSWQPYAPACNALCPRFFLSDGVNASTTATYQGSEVTFTCEGDGVLEGSTSTTCLSHGNWSQPPPLCIPATCPPLNPTAHLSVSSPDNAVGADVLFHCEEGWYVNGVTMVTCQLNGTWNAPQPTCELGVVCADFNDSRGDFVITNNITEALTPGTMVTVLCRGGLVTLGGVNVSTCSLNGNWSPGPPGCDAIVSTEESSSGSAFSGAQIGGLVVGVVAGLLLVVMVTAVLVALLVLKKRRPGGYGRLSMIFSKDDDSLSEQPLAEIVTSKE